MSPPDSNNGKNEKARQNGELSLIYRRWGKASCPRTPKSPYTLCV